MAAIALTAKATDIPVMLTITSPTNGSVLDFGNIEITASVEPTGRVNFVTFFVDTNRLGFDASYPFSFTWTNPPPGRHVLSVMAIDTRGGGVESPLIYVQIGSVFYDKIIRGPYLQSGTTSNVVIRWRTDWVSETHLSYGLSLNDLDSTLSDLTPKTDHEVMLTGLLPDTRYYYAIRTERNVVAAGATYSFVTAPRIGTTKPIRIWAIGDSGTGDWRAAVVRNAYLGFADDEPPDVWLMLGDNAYDSGTDLEFQRGVFDMYPTLLRQTVLWPTLGNHDVALRYELPYLSIFTLPRDGRAGGIASGTEHYYSFDYANIHFICVDSTSPTTPGNPMLIWLENDLLATAQPWIIAYWHYPPYSKGSHNSDNEFDLIQMRERVVPILEDHGVDLVLTGHSHVYERSYLLNGHYGYSTNLTPEMILDAGSGQIENDGAYRKPAGALGDRQGTVYVVCGCSGEGGANPFSGHPAMRVSLGGFGSMVIDVFDSRLDAQFLGTNSTVADHFTILKETSETTRPRLKVARSVEKTRVLWPITATHYNLESAANLAGQVLWRPVTNSVGVLGRRNAIEIDAAEPQRVFRLRR